MDSLGEIAYIASVVLPKTLQEVPPECLDLDNFVPDGKVN
jgi:hypothetical protein